MTEGLGPSQPPQEGQLPAEVVPVEQGEAFTAQEIADDPETGARWLQRVQGFINENKPAAAAVAVGLVAAGAYVAWKVNHPEDRGNTARLTTGDTDVSIGQDGHLGKTVSVVLAHVPGRRISPAATLPLDESDPVGLHNSLSIENDGSRGRLAGSSEDRATYGETVRTIAGTLLGALRTSLRKESSKGTEE